MPQLTVQQYLTLETFMQAELVAKLAARRVGISQGAFARRLTRLRDNLGFNDVVQMMVWYALFERGPEHVRQWADVLYPMVARLEAVRIEGTTALHWLSLASRSACDRRETVEAVARSQAFSNRTLERRFEELAAVMGLSANRMWLALHFDMYRYIDSHAEILL